MNDYENSSGRVKGKASDDGYRHKNLYTGKITPPVIFDDTSLFDIRDENLRKKIEEINQKLKERGCKSYFENAEVWK